MNTIVCTGAIGLVLAAAAAAQVFPVGFATAEGPAKLIPAVGTRVLPDRQLQVDGELMGLGPRTIHGLRLRRDALTRSPNPGFRIIVDVWLSHAATTPAAPHATFDRNHGADRTHVVQGKELRFPATTAYGMPESFEFDVPFQSSFAYDGVRPLCWDVYVSQTTNTVGVFADAVAGAQSNPQPAGIPIGSGCIVTGNNRPAALDGAAAANWLATPPLLGFVYNAGWLPANGSAVLFIGLARLEPPFPMSPGCSLFVLPAVTLPLLVQANGTASRGLSTSPSDNGISLFAQVLALDLLATPPSIVGTNAAQFNIVAPFAVNIGSVRAFGPQPQPGIPVTGVVAPGVGSIVQYY